MVPRPPGDAGIIPARHLPTPPLGQVLGERICGLCHRPLPSTGTTSAIAESGL
jgi:hypothetical protein